jgi:hypothetical protein
MVVGCAVWVLRPSFVGVVLPLSARRFKELRVPSRGCRLFADLRRSRKVVTAVRCQAREDFGFTVNESPSEWNLACCLLRSDCPNRQHLVLLSTHVPAEQKPSSPVVGK